MIKRLILIGLLSASLTLAYNAILFPWGPWELCAEQDWACTFPAYQYLLMYEGRGNVCLFTLVASIAERSEPITIKGSFKVEPNEYGYTAVPVMIQGTVQSYKVDIKEER